MKLKQKNYKLFVHKNGQNTFKEVVTMDARMVPPNSLTETYEEILPYNWDRLLTRLTFLFAAVTVALEFYDKVLKN